MTYLAKWIKSWKGIKREFHPAEWDQLCKELMKQLKMDLNLCNTIRLTLELDEEIVILRIKRTDKKVIVWTE